MDNNNIPNNAITKYPLDTLESIFIAIGRIEGNLNSLGGRIDRIGEDTENSTSILNAIYYGRQGQQSGSVGWGGWMVGIASWGFGTLLQTTFFIMQVSMIINMFRGIYKLMSKRNESQEERRLRMTQFRRALEDSLSSMTPEERRALMENLTNLNDALNINDRANQENATREDLNADDQENGVMDDGGILPIIQEESDNNVDNHANQENVTIGDPPTAYQDLGGSEERERQPQSSISDTSKSELRELRRRTPSRGDSEE